jgi:hypothetical protein
VDRGAARLAPTPPIRLDIPYAKEGNAIKAALAELFGADWDTWWAANKPNPAKSKGPARTPDAGAMESGYSKAAIRVAFNLSDEQDEAVDAIVEQMGLDTDQLRIASQWLVSSCSGRLAEDTGRLVPAALAVHVQQEPQIRGFTRWEGSRLVLACV